MLHWVRSVLDEQRSFLAEADQLQRQQDDAERRDAGLLEGRHALEGSIVSAAEYAHDADSHPAASNLLTTPESVELSRLGNDPPFGHGAIGSEAARRARQACSAHGLVAKLFGPWSTRDAALLWQEFLSMPARYVIPASLASVGYTWCEMGKGLAMGMVTDTFAAAAGPALGLTATADGHASTPLQRGLADTQDGAGKSFVDVILEWRAGLFALMVVFGVSLAEWACSICRDYCFARARAERLLSSRTRYMASIMRQDLAFHDSNRSVELAERLQKDPDAVDDIVLYTLERLLKGFTAVGTIVVMVRTDWQITAVAIALRIPFMLQLVETSVRVASSYDRLQRHALEKAQARAQESISNVRLVQSNTAEALETRGYASMLYRYLTIMRGSALARTLLHHLEGVILVLTQLIILAFGAYRIRTGSVTFGRFQAYTAAAGSFVSNFHGLEAVYNSLRLAAISSRRFFALRDRNPAVPVQLPDVHSIIAELQSSVGKADDAPMMGKVASSLPIASRNAEEEAPCASVPSSSISSTDGLRHRKRRPSTANLAATAWTDSGVDSVSASASPARAPPPTSSVSLQQPYAYTSVGELRSRIQGRIVFDRVSFQYPGTAGSSSTGSNAAAVTRSSLPIAGIAAVTAASGAASPSAPGAGGRGFKRSVSSSSHLSGASMDSSHVPGARPVSSSYSAAVPGGGAGGGGSGGGGVLSDVSLTIEPGQVVAFVGPSGAGKTTVARLLLRFFDPTGGSILLDGVDMRSIDPRALRGCVGMVDQDTSLLDRSVAANICLGFDTSSPTYPSRARIEAAARQAYAHDFIMALPNGYDTLVGEKGGRLSGGQRQRIAIARAILRDPQILLLDEATAALDSESEAAVSAALKSLMAGRTTVIIAHRLSTIAHANKVVVLQKGSVVEVGTHAEILRQHPRGIYARLLEYQKNHHHDSS